MFNRKQVVNMTEDDPFKWERMLVDMIETVQDGGLKIEEQNNSMRGQNNILKTEIENNVEIWKQLFDYFQSVFEKNRELVLKREKLKDDLWKKKFDVEELQRKFLPVGKLKWK